jgi:hypothetical protein
VVLFRETKEHLSPRSKHSKTISSAHLPEYHLVVRDPFGSVTKGMWLRINRVPLMNSRLSAEMQTVRLVKNEVQV